MGDNGLMSTPRLSERPSFAQRDAYRDVLSDGFAQGRLADEDFDVRLQLVHEADRLSDLESLISDLPRGDLPVPVGSAGGPGSGAGAGVAGMPALSRGSKVLALVLVGIPLVAGVCLGAVTVAARNAQQPASDAGIVGVVDAEESEVLEYRDVARGVEFVAQQDAPTTVRMSPGMVHLEVPTEDGTAYDSVVLLRDGRVSSDPGTVYADEEAPPLVDADDLDADVLAAIVMAAPQVYEEHVGEVPLPVDRLSISADHVDDGYAGFDAEEPVVTVWFSTDEYGAGGGRVVYALDGSRVLEVTE